MCNRYVMSKRKRLQEVLSFRVAAAQRLAIEQIADGEDLAIAEVARNLLSEGLRARGIECR